MPATADLSTIPGFPGYTHPTPEAWLQAIELVTPFGDEDGRLFLRAHNAYRFLLRGTTAALDPGPVGNVDRAAAHLASLAS